MAFAWLDRTTTFLTYEPEPQPPHSEDMTGLGVGGQLEVAAAWPLGDALELGASVQVGYVPMTLFETDTALTSVYLGPEMTVRRENVHLRGHIRTGRLTAGDVGGAYDLQAQLPLGLIETGLEIGYEHPLSPGWAGQIGFGVSAAWGRSGETADHGDYVDRMRLVTAALTLSIAQSADP